MKGIDCSHWNGIIDWRAVRASGVEYAYIKATEGSGFLDSRFVANWQAAQNAGVKVGAYHFYRAGYAHEKQAQHYKNTVGALTAGKHLIPMIDVEFLNLDAAYDIDDATQNLALMVLDMEAIYGKPIGIYTGGWCWNPLPHRNRFGHLPLWMASYTGDPGHWPSVPEGWGDRVALHQYSSTGRVPGVTGDCDLNYCWDIKPLMVGTVGGGGDETTVQDLKAALEAARAALTEATRLLGKL